jgi:tetratricopeptide (TPR) repeat protein
MRRKSSRLCRSSLLAGCVPFLFRSTENAVVQLKEALRLEPDNPLALAMLGKVYSYDKKKLSLAEDLLKKAVSLNPDSDETRFDLARVFAQRGDLEKSLREFSILLRGEIRYAVYHTELGMILAAGGKKEDARREFKRALVIFPGFGPAKKELEALDEPIEKKESPSPPGKE